MRPRRERGSGTVLMLAVVAVVLVLTIGAVAVGSAVLAAHRARSAADLAALAAAGTLAQGRSASSACAVAGAMAARNSADLVGCAATADGSVVVHTTAGVVVGLPGQPRSARALARAGPAQ